MSKNKQTKKRPVISPGWGPDLVLLCGLPRDTLKWIRDLLTKDPTAVRAEFEGVPSTPNDFADLYPKPAIRGMHDILAESVSDNRIDSELPPRRMLVLYVPAEGVQRLMDGLGLFCYMEPIVPDNGVYEPYHGIGWRHQKSQVKVMVYNALQRALLATDRLTFEITNKRMSPLALPARNFYFPTTHSTMADTYTKFRQSTITLEELKERIIPKKFTKDELASKAFKGNKNSDRFFQDKRDRIFPPDRHAQNRYAAGREIDFDVELQSSVHPHPIRVLEQRYRFGVIVRDGNQHYDVQYASPRKLQNEPMYCAATGEVSVTATHANVGVNDVIWTPDGTKEPRGQQAIN